MFGAPVVALILTVLWLWPTSRHAQSEALMEAYRQGQALYQAGRYEQAIPFYREALELGEQKFGPAHPTTAVLLNKLAELYRNQGRYEWAEPLYKRVLAIDEKALGPEHPDVATDLNNLAALYHLLGRYEAAEPPYERALAVREKALGPEHPEVAQSLNNLAALYQLLGRYEGGGAALRARPGDQGEGSGERAPAGGTELGKLRDLTESDWTQRERRIYGRPRQGDPRQACRGNPMKVVRLCVLAMMETEGIDLFAHPMF